MHIIRTFYIGTTERRRMRPQLDSHERSSDIEIDFRNKSNDTPGRQKQENPLCQSWHNDPLLSASQSRTYTPIKMLAHTERQTCCAINPGACVDLGVKLNSLYNETSANRAQCIKYYFGLFISSSVIFWFECRCPFPKQTHLWTNHT